MSKPQTEGAAKSPFVIIRTYSAGVHFGYLASHEGKCVTLHQSRRVHYWQGAASLSQMAIDGIGNPKNSRVAMEVPSITLTEAIEIIPAEQARINLENQPVWKV